MKTNIKFLIMAILIAMFQLGCGGSSNENSTAAIVAATGGLQIDIHGLPIDTSGSVQISGPNGFNDEVSGMQTFTNLAPGRYTISANPVEAEGLEFGVQPSQYSLSVTANAVVTQSLVYMTDIVSTGVISNFGSVYVNGVRYNTDHTIVKTDDNDNADEDSLSVGMTVRVQGRRTADSATTIADEIEYEAKARGVVKSISLNKSQITVFNHIFSTDDSTVFVDTMLQTLVVGDVVEVSAISANKGLWLATRIEKVDMQSNYRLSGYVLKLDTEAFRFYINETLIDYALASVQGVLVEGSAVTVSTDEVALDGVLRANTIKVKVINNEHSNDEVSVDGVIQKLSNNTFSVNDTPVTWDEMTKFKGASTTSLIVGARVKVKGTIIDDVLVARRIRFDMHSLIEMEGAIQAIDLLENQLTLLDLTFLVDEFSQLKDESSEKRRIVNLDLLAAGDWVEIKAFKDGEQLIVKKLERQKTNSERENDVSFAKLKGSISEFEAPNLTVQGSVISTSELTTFEAGEFEVDASTFFEQLKIGDWVEIKGVRQQDGVILATKLETSSASGQNNDDVSAGIEFYGRIENFVSISKFSVNSRTITTNEFSQFTHGSETLLANGIIVEIHGREALDGSVLATRVNFEDDDEIENKNEAEAELKGTILVNAEDNQFVLGQRKVFFDEVTVFKNGDSQDLVTGAFVKVKGSLNQNGDINATRIQIEGEQHNNNEFEGEISQITDENEFMISKVKVLVTAETEFDNGNSSRLLAGVWVKVEGNFNQQQVLIANEIKFAKAVKVQLKGIIEQVANEIQFSMDGITFEHDQYTQFENGSANDLANGIKVEIKGFINDESIFEALEIEFDD